MEVICYDSLPLPPAPARKRDSDARDGAMNCKIIYFKKSRQSDWYLILINDLNSLRSKSSLGIFVPKYLCIWVGSSNSRRYLQNTRDTHSVVSSPPAESPLHHPPSPSIYYLKVNIKVASVRPAFPLLRENWINKKGGVGSLSLSPSESGSRPSNAAKLTKA